MRKHPVLLLPDDVDVVSFDVFDTLVSRVVARPTDVFEIMARERPETFGPAFPSKRVQAEATARRSVGTEEVTLDDIYDHCVLNGAVTIGRRAEAVEHEVETEIRLCVARPGLRILVDQALAAGCRVLAVSDMYLPVHAVRRILDRCGYTDVSDLRVSSQEGVTKHTGRMFERVSEGWRRGSWLHVGDNRHADVDVPGRLGFRTLHIPAPSGSKGWDDDAGLVGGGFTRIAAMVAERRPKLDDVDRFWQHVACAMAAPFVVGLCHEVRRRAAEVGADAIYFLARDGLIVQKAYAALFPGDARRSEYLHASRRVANFAAIERLDDRAVTFLLGAKDDLTVRDLLHRIGLSEEALVQRAVAASGLPATYVNPPRSAVEAAFREVEEEILNRAAVEREDYLGYLRQTGLLDSSRVVVVDVGWHCSVQRSLSSLLTLAGAKVSLHGVYVGTKAAAHRDGTLDAIGWLYQNDGPSDARRSVERCIEFVELLFASPEHGVVRMVRKGDEFTPVRFERTEEMHRMHVAARLHEGVVDACRMIREAELQDVMGQSAHVARGRLHAFLTTPEREAINHLSPLRHSLGFGSTTYRGFVADSDGRWHPRHMAKSLASSFWREGYVSAVPRQVRPLAWAMLRFGIPGYRATKVMGRGLLKVLNLAWRFKRRVFAQA